MKTILHLCAVIVLVPRGAIICRACMDAVVLIWNERRHDAEWRDADRVFSEAL